MVQKSVLRKIGVFAMTVMLAVAPIMAVNAESANQMVKAVAGTGDTTSDPGSSETPAPEDPTPAPEDPTPAPEDPTPVPEDPTPAPEDPTPAPEDPTPAPVVPTPDADEDAEDESGDNYVVATTSGQQLVSTVSGVYNVSSVPGVAITTPAGELPSGMTVEITNSNRGSKAAQSIQDGLTMLEQSGVSATKGPEIDIAAYINNAGKADLDKKVTISIGIPSGFKQAGCDYAVMLIQAGGRVSILPNISADSEYITVSTSGFGVYVIVKAPAGSFKMFQ